MFNQILVPLDGSMVAECVLPHALALSQASGARISLLRVLEQRVSPEQVWSVDRLNLQRRRVEAGAYLEEVGRRLEAAGGSRARGVEQVLLEGQAAERIVEFVHNNEHDLVVLSSHGRGGLSGWNVSSVAQKVMWRAYRSIFMVRAYRPQPAGLGGLGYGRIVAPLDGSSRAEQVLPVLAQLGQRGEAEVLLVHVVGRPHLPRRTPLSGEENELRARLVEGNVEAARVYLEQLKSRLPGEVDCRVVVSDSVIGSLHEVVDEVGGDLVLLNAHGYSAQYHHPYGSVVTSFIAYGSTPLLIMQDVPLYRIEPAYGEVVAFQNRNGGGQLVYE